METEKEKLKTFFASERNKESGTREDFSALLSRLEIKTETAETKKVWSSYLNYSLAFATCYVFIFWFVNLDTKDGVVPTGSLSSDTNTETLAGSEAVPAGTSARSAKTNNNGAISQTNTTNTTPNNTTVTPTAQPANTYVAQQDSSKQAAKQETLAALDDIDSFDNTENYEEL